MSDAAELADGFRWLRRVVHVWLARDLTGPPAGYTRAYADLMFAHAFARLGAADDARHLTAEAQTSLDASGPVGQDFESQLQASVAHHLSAMFRYRIDEALDGRPPRPTLPRDLLPTVPQGVVNSPELRVEYVTAQARTRWRVLEHPGLVNVYAHWTSAAGLSGPVESLLRNSDRGDLEERLSGLLAEADREESGRRVAAWNELLPLAAAAGDGFRADLLFRVPSVVADTLPTLRPADRQPSPDAHLRPAVDLVAHALRHAAAMPGAEPFPPLVDAALAVLSAAGTGRAAAVLGWECVCWFRRLGAEEADVFLHRTAAVWPAGDPARPAEAQAAAIQAGLLNVAGRDAEGAARLDAVARVLSRIPHQARGAWLPRDTAEAATAYARAASTDHAAVDRLAALFPALPPIRDTWTTAPWYARLHLEVADAMLLAFPAVRGV